MCELFIMPLLFCYLFRYDQPIATSVQLLLPVYMVVIRCIFVLVPDVTWNKDCELTRPIFLSGDISFMSAKKTFIERADVS